MLYTNEKIDLDELERLGKMGRAILEISIIALDLIFIKQPKNSELHIKIAHALPEDAEFCSCHYDHTRQIFQLVYRSNEFAKLGPGDKMPVLPPIEFMRIGD